MHRAQRHVEPRLSYWSICCQRGTARVETLRAIAELAYPV